MQYPIDRTHKNHIIKPIGLFESMSSTDSNNSSTNVYDMNVLFLCSATSPLNIETTGAQVKKNNIYDSKS